MVMTTAAATESSRFPTATNADNSKVKKGLLKKVGRGIGQGFLFVVQLPSNVLKEKDGFDKVVKAGASVLEVTVLALGVFGGIKSSGLETATTLVKGVKKFINLIEIFDNIHDLADYLKKPRELAVSLWVIPKVASTVLFTISGGMGVAEWAMTTFNVGTKALSFTLKGFEKVPVFGFVAQVLGGAGVIASISLKGYDIYEAVKGFKKADKKLTDLEKLYSHLNDEGKSEIKFVDVKMSIDSLIEHYNGKIGYYERKEAEFKKKKVELENIEAELKKPEANGELKKERRELTKNVRELTKDVSPRQQIRLRKRERRLALLKSTKKDLTEKGLTVEGALNTDVVDRLTKNFKDIIDYKKANFVAKKSNHIRAITKSSTGIVLNVAKVALLAVGIAFMATGLVGLPFAAILMGAGLAINVGGLVDYTVWKFYGEEKVAAPAA